MRQITHTLATPLASDGARFGDVFDPNTGEVQAKVALASRAETEQAIANAAAPTAANASGPVAFNASRVPENLLVLFPP